MLKERASKRQQELLSFVDGFIKGSGYGPSYREIMRALGYKSVSTVAIHIDNLIAKGYLQRKDNSARSLEVVTMRSEETASAKSSLDDELMAYLRQQTLSGDERETVLTAMKILGFPKATEVVEEKKEPEGDVESN